MWGIYKHEKEIHIVPCLNDGKIEKPHKIDIFCFCCPECIKIGDDGRLIINHNKEN